MADIRRTSRTSAMSRKGNRSAAFTAVSLGQIDKLDAALIARCHGLTIAEVEAMVAARRDRERMS